MNTQSKTNIKIRSKNGDLEFDFEGATGYAKVSNGLIHEIHVNSTDPLPLRDIRALLQNFIFHKKGIL